VSPRPDTPVKGSVVRVLLWLHAGELIAYIIGGIALWCVAAFSPSNAVMLAIAVALGLRATIVLFTFALTFRTMPHGGPRLPLLRKGRLLFVELCALIILFSWRQPLERWSRRVYIAGNVDSSIPPVLFVHGIYCNGAIWHDLAQRLQRRGFSSYLVSLEPLLGDIECYAAQLELEIDRVRGATGAAQVAIIAHSMGGLVARAYLRRCGAQKVAKLITLACPHHGSALARLAIGANGHQLRPGNPWLVALNQPEPSPVPIVSIYSRHDNFVAPQASAELTGAVNIVLDGVGHLSMLFSTLIERLLADALLPPSCPGDAHR
jgi:triacylglycerol lipase